MKIVGRTDAGYLVEATELELANVAGHAYAHQAPWAQKRGSGYGHDAKPIPTGTVIEVTNRFQHLLAMETREADVREAAGTLRALATLAEKTLPSVLFPPEPEAEAPAPEASASQGPAA
jgi:hypothetical protein